jgi:hypothetical protein
MYCGRFADFLELYIQAVQLLRGTVPAESDGNTLEMTFYQIFNGFIAM